MEKEKWDPPTVKEMGFGKCELKYTLADDELEKIDCPPSTGYYKAIMKVLRIIDQYKVSPTEAERSNKE